jgi:LysR family transcriptional regulator, nitrogen assimilation regulatory protein
MQRALPQSALAGRPLLQIRAPNQIRWVVDSALRRLAAPTEPTMEVSSSIIQLDLVEDGHGFTVLPRSLLLEAVQQRAISAAPLARLSVTWVAAWQKGKQPARATQIALDTLLEISAGVPAQLRAPR